MAQGSAGNGAKDAEVQSLSRRRPGMDLFRASLEILDEPGMPADHAVMIGDSEYDMEMAQNAGRNSIAVSYGVHDRSRLLKYKPLVCLDSLSDLLNRLPALY